MDSIMDIVNIFTIYYKSIYNTGVVDEFENIDYTKDTFHSKYMEMFYEKMEEEKKYKNTIKSISVFGAEKVEIDEDVCEDLTYYTDGRENESTRFTLKNFDFADIKEEKKFVTKITVYNTEIYTDTTIKKNICMVTIHAPSEVNIIKLNEDKIKDNIKKLAIYEYNDFDTDNDIDSWYVLEINGKKQKICYCLLPLIRYLSLIPDWSIIKWKIYRVTSM